MGMKLNLKNIMILASIIFIVAMTCLISVFIQSHATRHIPIKTRHATAANPTTVKTTIQAFADRLRNTYHWLVTPVYDLPAKSISNFENAPDFFLNMEHILDIHNQDDLTNQRKDEMLWPWQEPNQALLRHHLTLPTSVDMPELFK